MSCLLPLYLFIEKILDLDLHCFKSFLNCVRGLQCEEPVIIAMARNQV